MKTLLRKCPMDGTYTLKDQCPKCGGTTLMPMPAKYSPDDKYGVYRRRLKKEMGGGG